MKALILELFSNFWAVLNSIAFLILLGVLLTAAVKHLLPESLVKKQLAKLGFLSTLKAAFLGILLPTSGHNIPFINALQKAGATKSTTQSLLVATPMNGVDSSLVSYAVFGWAFALYKFFATVLIALIAGFLSQFLKEKEELTPNTPAFNKDSSTLGYPVGIPLNIQVVKAENSTPLFKQIFAYAFDTLLKEYAFSLLFSLTIAALIISFSPENLSNLIASNTALNYLFALFIALIAFAFGALNATTALPIGIALLVVGFSPGAVLLFLSINPVVNSSNIQIIIKTLGKTSLAVYLFSVLFGNIILSVLFDTLFSKDFAEFTMISASTLQQDPGFIAQISAVIILYLSLKYSINKKTKVFGAGGCSSEGGCASSGCGTK